VRDYLRHRCPRILKITVIEDEGTDAPAYLIGLNCMGGELRLKDYITDWGRTCLWSAMIFRLKLQVSKTNAESYFLPPQFKRISDRNPRPYAFLHPERHVCVGVYPIAALQKARKPVALESLCSLCYEECRKL